MGKKTVWVMALCEFLRELAEKPTEDFARRDRGVCALLDDFGYQHGSGRYDLASEFEDLSPLWSGFSGSWVFPVAGDVEYYDDEHKWDNEKRREYCLELADLIEEAWEASA